MTEAYFTRVWAIMAHTTQIRPPLPKTLTHLVAKSIVKQSSFWAF